MAGPSIPARLSIESQQWEAAIRREVAGLRVALPGIVQSFDPVAQTVKVQLAIKETVKVDGVPTPKSIPILGEVPVMFPRAGNFVLTMPVTPGDECLVIFSDLCIDSWWQSGGVQNRMSGRRHDFSDGFAIIGPWSQPNVISDYSTDSAFLRNLNNDSYVEVRDNDINIKTPMKVTITAGSEVEVNAPTVDVNATDVNVKGEASVIVEAPVVTVQNAVTVGITGGIITLTGSGSSLVVGAGNVMSGGVSQIDGKDFLTHTHINGGGVGDSGVVA